MIFGGRTKRNESEPRARSKAISGIETILGPNTSIQGDLRSSGGVRVDGDFGGTIDIAGNLIVSENAKVVADVSAHNVQIQGTIQGDVTAKRLEILDTGKLWGDISVESFVLDDGGFYQGQSKMQTDLQPPLLEAPNQKAGEVLDADTSVKD